jgi:hypothetical protein
MRESELRQYLEKRDLSERTIALTVYALKRIERAYNIDLDAEFDRDRLESLVASFLYSTEDERSNRANPSKMEMDQNKIYSRLAWYRHKVRLYLAFRSDDPIVQADFEQDVQPDGEDVGRTFALERDLQAALRANIQQLENGLTIADNGVEARVEAGLIDILAKDDAGRWVVIELKADVARPAAMTQVLAYVACIAAERGGDARGILVASDFNRKIVLASRSLPNLTLKRYRFQFFFE